MASFAGCTALREFSVFDCLSPVFVALSTSCAHYHMEQDVK